MPEKLLQTDHNAISGLSGLIGLGVSSLGALGIVIFKWVLKRQDDKDKENTGLKKDNEDEYRKTVAGVLETQWRKFDGLRKEFDDMRCEFAALQARFEDLQQAHIRMSCGKMISKKGD